jgi:hypothetical protein
MPQSLSDEFFNGFANAVDDIRQQVVEEPFFGRAVTDSGPDVPRWPETREVEPAQDIEQEIDLER